MAARRKEAAEAELGRFRHAQGGEAALCLQAQCLHDERTRHAGGAGKVFRKEREVWRKGQRACTGLEHGGSCVWRGADSLVVSWERFGKTPAEGLLASRQFIF